RRRGPDQLLAHEPDELRVDPTAGAVHELDDGTAVKDLALDGTSLDHLALRSTEPVETGLQERLDRRRCPYVAALEREREHFLDEQRVTGRGLDDPRARVVRNVARSES